MRSRCIARCGARNGGGYISVEFPTRRPAEFDTFYPPHVKLVACDEFLCERRVIAVVFRRPPGRRPAAACDGAWRGLFQFHRFPQLCWMRKLIRSERQRGCLQLPHTACSANMHGELHATDVS